MVQDANPRIASDQEIIAFDQALLRAPPEGHGTTVELEAPYERLFLFPRFIADLSGANISPTMRNRQSIHGSFLVRRENVMLFGSSNLVSTEGFWSCENREGKGVYLAYLNMPFFKNLFPGDLPELIDIHTKPRISTANLLKKGTVAQIDEPIFLATPLEPPIWGRWVANVMPRVKHYLSHGPQRKFLCHVQRPWERKTLNALGISDERIIPHEPGQTYLCRDVMMVEYAGPALAVSGAERAIFKHIVEGNQTEVGLGKKLFVSRLSTTNKNPNYRPLVNEADLVRRMEDRGFSIIEPELMALPAQISTFARAEAVVFVGGSAIFNAAFCQPGTRVVTIESSGTFLQTHMEYFSSLDLEYAVIFGKEDPKDERPNHRRWSIDIDAAMDALEQFVMR